MLQRVPRALYVWCHAHRLNLVVESMLCCCMDIRKAIGLMQELHNFFNGHRRHAVFVEQQANESRCKTLKRVSDTTRSWRSVEDGVVTFLDCYAYVEEALERILNDSKDASTVNSASGLLKQIADFNVIVCIHILKFVFRITGPASRILQGVAIDLSMVSTLIQGCLDNVNDIANNTDTHWKTIVEEAKYFAASHGIEPTFQAKRHVKRMAGELTTDNVSRML